MSSGWKQLLGLRPQVSLRRHGSKAEGEEWVEIAVGSFLRVEREGENVQGTGQIPLAA